MRIRERSLWSSLPSSKADKERIGTAMDNVIVEWITSNISAVMYALAIMFLIGLFSSATVGVDFVNKMTNQKYNVYEMTQDEETVTEMDGIPLSGVLYDIKEAPKGTVIKVGSYTITDEDRKALVEYGDASEIIRNLKQHIKSKYTKTYVTDKNGNITMVTYQIQI